MSDINLTSSSTIMYDAAVTTTDLANIAIDLGNSTFTFTETKFGADALNQITEDLATAGIIPGLLDEFEVASFTNSITVKSGVAIFGDGSKVRSKKSLNIDKVTGEDTYLRLVRANDGNVFLRYTSEPKIASYEQSVELARFDSEGNMTSTRQYAQGRTALASNLSTTVDLSGVWSASPQKTLVNQSQLLTSGTAIPYHYAVISLRDKGYDRSDLDFGNRYGETVLYNLQTNTYTTYSGESYTSLDITGSMRYQISFEYSDGYFKIYTQSDSAMMANVYCVITFC